MKRREFLKDSALLALAAGTLPTTVVSCKNNAIDKGTCTPLSVEGSVVEPQRRIPVIDHADVVVLGGGPAGVSAAISAARQGADVMLLERQFYLGGLWTGGCVLPVIDVYGKAKQGGREQAIHGFMSEITSKLSAMDMLIHKGEMPVPDPEAAKYVLEQMVHEAGVRVLYNCQGANVIMSGDRIDCIIVETKSGRVAIKAKCFVDCSGDGDLLEWSGEDFELRSHHIGAMWRCGNMSNWKNPKDATPIDSVKYFWWRGEEEQNGLDVYNVTRMQFNIRRHIWESLKKIQKMPGCENAFILDSGTLPGVRITRVLNSVCNVDYDKSLHYAEYEDCVGMSGGDVTLVYRDAMPGVERPVWQIPYRSLTPKRVQNLLVAGRCFGFDQDMVYDAREVGTCFVTGQAAGTAAAVSALNRVSVRDVDVVDLRNRLKQQNVKL